MPELPEVETVVNYLKEHIISDSFAKAEIYSPKLRIPIPQDLSQKIANQEIISIKRRAKYIFINLRNNITLLCHLGMTGKILLSDIKSPKAKHDHIIFKLKSGRYLSYNDQRRFGLITYDHTKKISDNKLIHHLGVEPLSTEFNGNYLYNITRLKQLAIKKFIMEQKNIVGVGNIYAVEALFLSKIHPEAISQDLSRSACQILSDNIKLILNQAIARGGSTIKDYESADGNAGYFQHEFKIYGREKKPCKACDTKIERIIQGGRSTFYCSRCQKK